jgi:glutamate/tyrosine decarboxylase-like PLP-dependent enzyme
VEAADSWATDGHKWLQTPYECGYAIVRDEAAHRRSMTITASYLPAVTSGERDPSHYVPELSRRARGFATWAMIRALGSSGIAAMIEKHCRLAGFMAARLVAEPGIVLENDVILNQAIFRFGPGELRETGDRLTEQTTARIQSDGVCFVAGAKWRGRQVMRLSVSNIETTKDDAQRSVDAIVAAWRIVRQGG